MYVQVMYSLLRPWQFVFVRCFPKVAAERKEESYSFGVPSSVRFDHDKKELNHWILLDLQPILHGHANQRSIFDRGEFSPICVTLWKPMVSGSRGMVPAPEIAGHFFFICPF